jgi:hypothetical protein
VLLADSGSLPQSCLSWSYTLVVDQNYPSRMAVVKNVLGDSVNITTPWVPPLVWPALTNPNWQCSGSCTITGPAAVDVPPASPGLDWTHTYTWSVTYDTPQVDPGSPFGLYATPASDPTRTAIQATNPSTWLTWPNVYTDAGDVLGSGAIAQPALKVVSSNAGQVNWGLLAFSTDVDGHSGQNSFVSKQKHILAMIDSSDSGDVTTIEAALQLFANGGTNVFGSTPTSGALEFAKTILQDVAQGTPANAPLEDDLGNSFTLPPDPKFECNRQYASILVTDGLSNVGNPGGCGLIGWGTWGNWIEPCLPCDCSNATDANPIYGGLGCPDGGDSGVICPDQYTLFAAGKAEEAWLADVLDPVTGLPRQLKARTWVIGISQDVGPCELNYTAYRGRTDASDPSGLAGIDSASGPDPYLPEGNPGTYDGPIQANCSNFVHDPGHTKVGDGNYAFFAGSATQLYDAISKVLSSYGVGDYTTSAPSISNTASATTATNIGFITTAEYPTWRGHVYAYDLNAPIVCTSDSQCPTNPTVSGACNISTGECMAPDTFKLLWDGGAVLHANNNGKPRRIYTWNGTTLIAVEKSNEGALNTVCGNCGITDQVVDFIRGNNGSGAPRPWQLGAIVNSTAAIIGKPEEWKQVTGHLGFETTYAGRNSVAWMGSSDGMVHGFDVTDGSELVALIPPDKLANQVTLYNTYKANPADDGMGQQLTPNAHLYGVANSPRFADVLDGSNYVTMMYITEGPGGTGVHAIDATHPTPTDPNYGYGTPYDPFNPEAAPPVQPMWSRTQDGRGLTTALADLNQSWSIPGIGGTQNATNWELVMGNGYTVYDPSTPTTAAATGNPAPHYLRLDPLTGAQRSDNTVTNFNTNQTLGGPWVRNQMFAHSTIWSTTTGYYQPDDDVNEGVQVDLQGHVWLLDRQNMSTSNWNNPQTLSDPGSVIAGEPLYYSPAVANYPSDLPVYNVFAFSSGTFYEVSTYINGGNVGIPAASTGPKNFIPALYLVSRTNVAPTTTTVDRIPIPSITSPDSGTTFTIASGVTSYVAGTSYFRHRTQVTASPLLLTPRVGSNGNVIALYLLFDPDAGCKGLAYVVRLDFDPGTLTVAAVKVAQAGEGAASGMVLAGTLPVVSKSFAGTGGKAYFFVVKDLPIAGAGGAGAPIAWWRELQ